MMTALTIAFVFSAWCGHTDRSRADATAFRAAVASLGWKYEHVAALMGISEKQLCRQLAGVEPMNHWRIAELPPEFQQAFDERRAALRGAVVLDPQTLSLIRAAVALGRKNMAKLVPELLTERKRA
jgi:hypothetical protein